MSAVVAADEIDLPAAPGAPLLSVSSLTAVGSYVYSGSLSAVFSACSMGRQMPGRWRREGGRGRVFRVLVRKVAKQTQR